MSLSVFGEMLLITFVDLFREGDLVKMMNDTVDRLVDPFGDLSDRVSALAFGQFQFDIQPSVDRIVPSYGQHKVVQRKVHTAADVKITLKDRVVVE